MSALSMPTRSTSEETATGSSTAARGRMSREPADDALSAFGSNLPLLSRSRRLARPPMDGLSRRPSVGEPPLRPVGEILPRRNDGEDGQFAAAEDADTRSRREYVRGLSGGLLIEQELGADIQRPGVRRLIDPMRTDDQQRLAMVLIFNADIDDAEVEVDQEMRQRNVVSLMLGVQAGMDFVTNYCLGVRQHGHDAAFDQALVAVRDEAGTGNSVRRMIDGWHRATHEAPVRTPSHTLLLVDMALRKRPPDNFIVSDNFESSVDCDYTPSSSAERVGTLSPIATRRERPLLNRVLDNRPRQSSRLPQTKRPRHDGSPSEPSTPVADVYDFPPEEPSEDGARHDEEGGDDEDQDDARVRDDKQDSLMSELRYAPQTHIPRTERRAVTKSRSKLRRQSECLLEGSDISDFWSENEYSDEEELNFAAEEEQMEARLAHEFPQQKLDIPEYEDVGQLEDWDETEHEDFVPLVRAIGRDGLLLTIRRAIKAEADSGSCLGSKYLEKLKDWDFNALLTLYSMDSKVIGELTHGNLVLASQHDDDLRELLEKYHERSKRLSPVSTHAFTFRAMVRRCR